eukprot:jgi/Chrzof1/13093/Cz07g19160.t1
MATGFTYDQATAILQLIDKPRPSTLPLSSVPSPSNTMQWQPSAAISPDLTHVSTLQEPCAVETQPVEPQMLGDGQQSAVLAILKQLESRLDEVEMQMLKKAVDDPSWLYNSSLDLNAGWEPPKVGPLMQQGTLSKVAPSQLPYNDSFNKQDTYIARGHKKPGQGLSTSGHDVSDVEYSNQAHAVGLMLILNVGITITFLAVMAGITGG